MRMGHFEHNLSRILKEINEFFPPKYQNWSWDEVMVNKSRIL
jgi:hypothetical protein